MNYTHLTQHARYQIAVLRTAGHTQGDISKLLNWHSASAVSSLCTTAPLHH